MAVDRNMKVLLVEDSQITRKMEIKALNEIGFHNIVQADDGGHAVERLSVDNSIHIIISDWNMPKMDGIDLLKWVRNQEAYKHTPFIMATARGEKKQAQMAEELGVTSMITKPFSPAELEAVIEAAFSEKRPEKEGNATRKPEMSPSGKLVMNVAHIQITDHLTLGVLKHLIESGKLDPKLFELKTHRMGGWNSVQAALEKAEIDAALILAPIAMDLFSYGIPLKLVLLAHKNGSISVQKKAGPMEDGNPRSYFRNKTFYLPHTMSIHHMLSHMFFRETGLKAGFLGENKLDVQFEVVPPVRMPELLASNADAGGFMVAEPMGTKAIAEGSAHLLFLSGELWENHPCCVVAMREEIIKSHPEAVQEFVGMMVQAGEFIHSRPDSASEIGVPFLDPTGALGLKAAVLRNVLKENKGIRTNDLFPVTEDFDRMQQYMVREMGVGTLIDLSQFIDTRFAEVACKDIGARSKSSFMDIGKISRDIVTRKCMDKEDKSKLTKEGKYLFFSLAGQEYGLSIFSVKEVIRMQQVRSVPKAPAHVRGVINLRGKVIPLLDLAARFGIDTHEYGERSCIVVTEIHDGSRRFPIAIAVDSVSEVLEIKAQQIDDSFSILDANTAYVLGMAKIKGGLRILLDTASLFNKDVGEMALDTQANAA